MTLEVQFPPDIGPDQIPAHTGRIILFSFTCPPKFGELLEQTQAGVAHQILEPA